MHSNLDPFFTGARGGRKSSGHDEKSAVRGQGSDDNRRTRMVSQELAEVAEERRKAEVRFKTGSNLRPSDLTPDR